MFHEQHHCLIGCPFMTVSFFHAEIQIFLGLCFVRCVAYQNIMVITAFLLLTSFTKLAIYVPFTEHA